MFAQRRIERVRHLGAWHLLAIVTSPGARLWLSFHLEFLFYRQTRGLSRIDSGMGKLPRRSRPARTLRVLRAERELTQHQIATRIGMTQTRYWQIEHGEGAPLRKDERAAIARMLEVQPFEIAWPEMKPTQLQVTRAAARDERRRQAEVMAGGRA